MIMTPAELARRHIRRKQYVSCDEAFVDVRLPGSSPKENYSIIGPGVTQSSQQVVNLRQPHGFNVGAAGLAPGITNNLHLHFTAEVFIACEGDFLLRWGVRGDEGEMHLHEGDVVCMPTWMFRGFSNVGTRHGFLMTVLGGDDTGGIIWSPEVLRRARATGLWLGRDNQLIEVRAGAPAPAEDQLLSLMPDAQVQALRHWSVAELGARAVRCDDRAWRLATLDAAGSAGQAWRVAPFVGWGISQHREHRPAVTEPQGFSIEWIDVPAGQRSAPFVLTEDAVLVHAQGPLAVDFNTEKDRLRCELGAWDTLSLPAGVQRAWANTGSTAAQALLVVRGDGRKRMQFGPEVAAAAAANDVALDASGLLATKSLLPPAMVL